MMKNEKERENYQHGIVVDCANGVGSIILKEILGFAGFPEKLPCTLINDSEKPDHLNDNCGAEHVQKEQKLPSNWNHVGKKCMSFDGDADRQMYFYQGEDGKLEIIDGDKQFALIMMYIKNKLSELGVLDKLSHILVQTAYCNSKVTKFLNDNGINNQLVKTGVKYAHPVVKNYDIGANDEPNGHGAVAFKIDKLEEVLKPINTIESQKLLALLNISNIVVGDAIANMLLMEAIMYDLDMSI